MNHHYRTVFNRKFGGAVAEYGKYKIVSVFGIDDGDVDFKIRNADVAAAFVAVLRKLGGDIPAYAVFVYYYLVGRAGNGGSALFGKFKKGFKPRHTARGGAREIYHRIAHRREYYHLLSRS